MEKIYTGEIQRLFPILEAIKEGKTIQWNDMGVWCDINGDDEGFVLDTLIGKPDGYRIKPEPTYRPFKDAEECWAEMYKHHPFGWVIKKGEKKILITEVLTFGVNLYRQEVCYGFYQASKILTFADGLPFGVKEQELLWHIVFVIFAIIRMNVSTIERQLFVLI